MNKTGEELKQLFAEFRDKVDIKDRSYHLKKYPDCFIGSEAVTVMQKMWNLKSREEAVEYGKRFLENGFMFHVTYEHNFKDDFLFYRISLLDKLTDNEKKMSFKKKLFYGNIEDFEKNYEMKFDSVFFHDEMNQEFLSFLKMEANLEPFEFLIESNKLEDTLELKDTSGQIKLMNDLIKIFIKTNAEKELNISGRSKRLILDEIEKIEKNGWKFDKSPKSIFEEITSSVRKDLYFDTWPRFKRTQKCLKIGMENIGNSSLVVHNGPFFFSYEMKDFENPVVSELKKIMNLSKRFQKMDHIG